MIKKQKLELTWIGKDEQPVLEPRILIEDPTKSYGDPHSENMLIHGDNLLALKALEQKFAGKIKCVFIDLLYGSATTQCANLALRVAKKPGVEGTRERQMRFNESCALSLLGLGDYTIVTTPGERIAAANAMERVDQKILDQQLGLRAMGYTSSVVVALGYRSASDANASLPKSRRPLEAILTRV